VLAVSLTLCYGGLIVYCLVTFPGLGYFPLAILLALALSTICQVAAMVAGAVIISLNARTMRAANVMASFIILPMSVVLQVEAALILVGRAEFLWGFALLMAVVAVVFLRMGLAGFSREALLARDVGLRHPLRRALGAVRASFNHRPSFVRLVWKRRVPMLIAAAPIWMASPPAMIAAGISMKPFGTMPLKAKDHDVRAAANPRMNPGARVRRNPLKPAVRTATAATRMKASTLWLKMASASEIAPPPPADRTRLVSTGLTTFAGMALVEPAM